MQTATVQPGRLIHLTFPRLGWLVFQFAEKVTVIEDYPDEQQALVQLKDGSMGMYQYTGRITA